LLGLFASAIVALALCPLPRSDNLSAARAILLAVAYVMESVGIGAVVLAASGTVLGWRKSELSDWWVLPIFCSVVAWMTPLLAFYRRDSLWAVLAAFVASMFGSGLIYCHYLAIRTREV